MEKALKPRILLHSCCGPCSTAVVERLAEEYDVTVFFYNPNITNTEEYELRKATQKKFIDAFNADRRAQGANYAIKYTEGPYDVERFCELSSGLENEPEGGARCPICFRMRMEMTAQIAVKENFDCFSTTLTVSPHKPYPIISEIGKDLAEQYGIAYADYDFKKKAGFQRSIELSRQYELYRQNFCGCDFAKKIQEEKCQSY